MAIWVNAIGYQIVWFCAVIGAGGGRAWPGVVAAIVFIAWEWVRSKHRAADARLVISAILIGCVLDGALAWSGWARYAAVWPWPGAAPVWILAVWASFAMTLTRSSRFIVARPMWALLLGAIGGPLAYSGASRGWHAVDFATPTWRSLLALAIGWSIALPLLALLTQRWARIQAINAADT
ncbi:MAG: DUF2878 domain-containing protein [Luteimonas sp.]